MGIPHFEDLSIDKILEIFDLQWAASEKLDGSYLKFGLDYEGKRYVERHGGIRYYDLSEWPSECWTDSFRPAHVTAFFLLDALIEEQAIAPGQAFGSEVIACRQPNAVEYRLPQGADGNLWITTADFTLSTAAYEVLAKFQTRFTYLHPRSDDGKDIIWDDFTVRWSVQLNQPIPYHSIQKLKNFTQNVKEIAIFFLDSESPVKGISMRELIELNLSKTPKADREFVKAERAKARDLWVAFLMVFKSHVGENIVKESVRYNGYTDFPEGFVIQGSNFTCKVTDRENFTKLNLFVHRVKYMLVGGRRPARSSFLSRTKDWDKAKRLARLDVLLDRYLNHYDDLFFRYEMFGKTGTMFYNGDLHYRMLNLFADVRQRIENGR